jgi:site-specific DNA-cytosine methylase
VLLPRSHKKVRVGADCGSITREAQQAKARPEVEAEKYLDRVFYYLAELQADPDGWDFEGELFQYAKEISEAIKPNLIEAMPLDFFAGRLQVEKFDEWLAAHL